MKLAVLFYEYVPDVLERREPHRAAHLAALGELSERGEVLLAGALGDPPHGAAIVFCSAQEAEAFAARDPYGSAGLVAAWRVEPWTVVTGTLAE